MSHGSMQVHVFRLKPHEDLKLAIVDYAKTHAISAGIILTCVGSLEEYNIRFANEKAGRKQWGYFEIVSLTGTFSTLSSHLHLSVSDSDGKTIGGHLLDGNHIYTTAEIAIGVLPELVFERAIDSTYGFPELVVKPK
ncbi:MAG TPA: PPC domain-containing DNA-binding protein [Chryseosolibacter sp.]